MHRLTMTLGLLLPLPIFALAHEAGRRNPVEAYGSTRQPLRGGAKRLGVR
jgi:hypothetical protein